MAEIETTEPEPTPARRSSRSVTTVLLTIFGVAVAVLGLDQLSKMWAQSSLVVGGEPEPLIGTLVQLRLIYNAGAALSIGSGATWVLTLLSAGVVVFIVVSARKIQSTAWAVALGLVLGGALGNLIDRLLRDPGFPNGHVVDFIDYGPFIGNVADIAIVGAAVLVGVLALLGIGPDGSRASDARTGDAVTAGETDAAPVTDTADDPDRVDRDADTGTTDPDPADDDTEAGPDAADGTDR